MNNVHPTTRNTPVRSAYSTLFSTDTSFSSIRLSCHVISLPTCTIGADRPTRNKFIDEAAVVGIMVVVDSFFTVVLDMTMSLYLFLDMYLHSGEYHVGTVGIDIRNYIFAVLMR